MNDQVKLQVLLEFETTGADREIKALREIQRGVDEASGANVLGEKSTKRLSKATNDLETSLKGAAGTAKKSEESIISLRYANYDLATTLLSTAAAITAVGAASVVAFATQERAFADVKRTLESGTVESVEALRQSFVDLSTEIPKSFNEISEIATLGNQLGVAEQDLEAFTRTVSAFSTITGISADSAAQAFGKLGNLLNVQVDEYDRLGSSIALVGRTTAATESQIISIASEIAPAAAAAGLSADAVIGLSGALGSLRVPPERSRSTILQFFEKLNMAVANGGQDLENFARVVGTTSAELESLVRAGQGEDILARFISSASTKDTVEVTQALQELGLAGLRTNPTIRALAGNMELFNSSIRTGKQGFAENNELQRQMAVIMDTLASKFQVFLNALTNFASQVGSELAPAFGVLIDLATQGLIALTEFADSPLGETLVRTAALIAGLGAAWLTLRGAIALATASSLAFQFVVRSIGGVGIIAGLKALAGSILALGGASNVASGFVAKLRFAVMGLLRATVIGGVLAYVAEWIFAPGEAAIWTGEQLVWLTDKLFEVGAAVNDFLGFTLISTSGGFTQTVNDWGQSLTKWGKELRDKQNDMGSFGVSAGDLSSEMAALQGQFGTDGLDDFGDGLGDLGDSAQEAAREIRTLVDYSNDLQQVWNRAFDIRFSGSQTLDAIRSSFISIREATEEASKRIRDLKNDIRGLTSDIDIQEYFLSIAIEYGDTRRAEAIEADLLKMRAELADKTAELQKEQDSASKSLVGNTKGAIDNRKQIEDLVKQYQAHIGALAASGMSQSQLAQATQRLKQDFIQQATQLGYNRQELNKYAKAFDDVAVAISRVPRNITVKANTNPAIQAFNEFKAAADKANSSISNLRNNASRGISVPTPKIPKARYEAIKIHGSDRKLYQLGLQQGALQGYLKDTTFFKYLGTYASGGFTGAGGKYEPAGVVHRGEYVIPKHDVNQATGMPYADALGRLMGGVRGMASGGPTSGSGSSGTTTMNLSAGSIQAIAQAVQPMLLVDGQQIGRVTSKAYSEQNTVGAF